MQAWIQTAYGSTDALQLQDRPVPELGPNEVLLRVQAVSLNYADRLTLLGRPKLFRPAFGGWRAPGKIACLDGAGLVEAVGAEVSRLKIGDTVFGELTAGSLAEFAVADEEALGLSEGDVAPELLACLPVAGHTAIQGLELAAIKPGDQLLVVGASGGVGTFAMQIAKARGAIVSAVCSQERADYCRANGADQIIDYRSTRWVDSEQRYDAIFDLAGDFPLSERKRCLKPDGIYIASFGMGGGELLGPVGGLLGAMLNGLIDKRIRNLMVDINTHHAELLAMVEAGTLRPQIAERFGFEEVPEAFTRLLGGGVEGKIVVGVGGE